jgi:hypothetical protein
MTALGTALRLAVVIASLAVVGSGCSISTSPSDSSEASSDSSGSSSRSSSPESAEASYRDDVRDYTAAYVKSSGGRAADFNAKLGELARNRGIANWEDNMTTYDGIGRGLAKAGVTDVERDTYVANLSGGDPKRAAAIRKGYDAGKS